MIPSGSLFTGGGMLDCAVSEVLGATPVWFAENDIDAAKVLQYHWPDVPNLGDITEVDWSTVAPIEILTAGFPCQDVSSAGKRVGMRPGNRSGLWSHAAYAISQLNPRLVVIENVRGLLSADAHCDLEPCSWCLGNKRGRPLRALGAVLGDLAGLGYDTQWCGIRASDIGAPHGRFRVFVVARPAGADPTAFRRGPTRGDNGVRAAGLVEVVAADAQGVGPVREGPTRRRGNGPADHDRPAADPASPRWGHLQPEHVREDSGETVRAGETEPRRCGGVAADADRERLERRGPTGSPASGRRRPLDPDRPVAADPQGVGRREGRTEPAGQLRGPDVAQRGDVAAADADRDAVREQPEPDVGLRGAAVAAHPRADIRGDHTAGQDDAAAADPAGSGVTDQPQCRDATGQPVGAVAGPSLGDRPGGTAQGIHDLAGDAGVVAWGVYAAAIRRWELILGRPAPTPTVVGKRGGRQLSPVFVEWLMGWPAGWVTDVPELSRNAKLKIAGNGVVPQQAAVAVDVLTEWESAA